MNDLASAPRSSYDVLVIGGGPAGHRAAIQAAKAGRSVLLVEQHEIGGECVRRGTIPSKTLREAALTISSFARKTGGVVPLEVPPALSLESLMARKGEVIRAHERFMTDQLRRNGVHHVLGRARFVTPDAVQIDEPGGASHVVRADRIVIATGSRPRAPEDVPIDHVHVLDSDSILSLETLPQSLVVLGSGVIACEYATIFAALGVEVSLVDRAAHPLGFLDAEIREAFVEALTERGVHLFLGRTVREVAWDGGTQVGVRLDDGRMVIAEKALCALGRVAQVGGLDLARAGLAVDARGHIPVDSHGRTITEGVYAAGDVTGPPALASTAMDAGRRAVRHALGLPVPLRPDIVPMGIYTIPEIASVGLSEAEARRRFQLVVAGYARFEELPRGHIGAIDRGLLKLVAADDGMLLGVHVIGEGAAELVHIGQLAIIGRQSIDVFVDNAFNVPTLTEAYRVAALDALARAARVRRHDRAASSQP